MTAVAPRRGCPVSLHDNTRGEHREETKYVKQVSEMMFYTILLLLLIFYNSLLI